MKFWKGVRPTTCHNAVSSFSLSSILIAMPRKSGKKRCRAFVGTQWQQQSPTKWRRTDSEAIHPSVSKTKLSSSPPRSIGFTAGSSSSLLRPSNTKSWSPLTNNSSEAGSSQATNYICSFGQLRDSVVQIHHCPKYPLTVSENSSGRRGLVSRVTLGCECGWFHM